MSFRTAPVVDRMIADYLQGPAYTVGTYLAYTLRGSSRRWGSYRRRMIARLEARADVETASSLRGGVAYRVRA